MDEQNSKSLLPVMSAIIITAIVVGGGIYWWQNTDSSQPKAELTTKTTPLPVLQPVSDEAVLLSVSEYGFKFVATKQCENYYEVKKVKPDYETKADAVYEVLLTKLSEPFSLTYSVMSKTVYDSIDDSIFSKPIIVLTLDNNFLVTAASPQDVPTWSATDTCRGNSFELKKT